MGIRGSTLEDKVQLRDLELHRFSLWRRQQFEAMWRKFKDSGLGFALDRDRLRLILAQNGGVEARSGPVPSGSGKVVGTSLDDPLLKLFPLFDTDKNDLIDAYEFMATLAVCSRMDRKDTLDFISSMYDFNQNSMFSVDEITIMMRTVVYGVAKVDAHEQTVILDTRDIERLANKCFKLTGIDEDGEVSFEQFLTYANEESTIRRYLEYCEDLLCPAEGLTAGTRFIDKEWTPEEGHSLYVEPLRPPRADLLPMNVRWRRLPDLSGVGTDAPPPVLFADDIHPPCACPGKFPNDWFIMALNVLLAKPQVVKALFVKTGQEQSHGRYCVRFFKDGIVRRVIVDDLVPCTQLGAPLCALAENEPGFAWVPIVEKAYAKLHGTYQALAGGTVDYALRDLTGGRVETVDTLSEEEKMDSSCKDKMWDKLKEGLIHGFVCATRPTTEAPGSGGKQGTTPVEAVKLRREDRAAVHHGLVLGYTYSVLELHKEISASGKKVRLVRLRIPPGSFRGGESQKHGGKQIGHYPGTNRRWRGAWSAGSREYRTEMHNKSPIAKNILLRLSGNSDFSTKVEEAAEDHVAEKSEKESEVDDEIQDEDFDADMDDGLTGNENQRTFVMSFEDFIRYFSLIRIVGLWDTGRWVRQSRHGEWTRNSAGGGLQNTTWTRNPQFALEVFDEPADVYIELGQDDPRYHLSKALGQPTMSREAKMFMAQPQEPKYEHAIGLLVVQHDFGSADEEENKGGGILRVRQFDRENVRAVSLPFVKDRNVTLSFVANPGKYIIVPMRLKAGVPGRFSLRVLSESEFDLFGEEDANWEDPPR